VSYQPQSQFGGGFSQPPQQQPKGCWGRNWKWIVPVGCLGLILTVVAIVVGIFFIAMSAVKSSEVYQEALGRAQYHPAVLAQLGDPVKDGWWVSGSVRVAGSSGYADFEIPISGPKKKATLYVVATKSGGEEWTFDKLDVAVEGGERFSILEPTIVEPPPPPPPDFDENSNGVGGGVGTPPPSSSKIISGGVLNGKAISKPQPAYPPIAKAARAQGMVTVQVIVDESGRVISATAVNGHPLLRAAAEAAARQARFVPTLLSGKPVKVSGVVTYNFVLE
jgi:TonB family protein